MNDKEILKIIEEVLNEKMQEDENYIRITFYELRVNRNLNEKETDRFLKLIRNKLENMEYNVYFTGARYTYNNANCTVQDNELMIAIKE